MFVVVDLLPLRCCWCVRLLLLTLLLVVLLLCVVVRHCCCLHYAFCYILPTPLRSRCYVVTPLCIVVDITVVTLYVVIDCCW